MVQTLTILIPDDMDIEDARAGCVEAIGWLAHDMATEDCDVFNAGWEVSGSEMEISIASKTSKGILQTYYNSETGCVSNTWYME